MSVESIFLVVLLGLMAYLFLSARIPVDLTAIFGVVVLTLTGYISAQEAFVGFSSPAVVTMTATFFLGTALTQTGVADMIGAYISGLAGKSEVGNIIMVMLVGALFSAVMTNVAATAVLLPVVASVASNTNIPPSRLLMPLCFAVVLGGMTTLIGTTPNIIITDILRDNALKPFEFFDFAPFGLTVVLLGTLFMAFLGRHLLPRRTVSVQNEAKSDDLLSSYRLSERIFSLRVPKKSALNNQTLGATDLGVELGVEVISILRGEQKITMPSADTVLKDEDVLIARGRIREGIQYINEKRVPVGNLGELELGSEEVQYEVDSEDIGLVEAVLSPRSSIANRTMRDLKFREKYGLQLLALWREGRPYRTELSDLELRIGDALLLQGPREQIKLMAQDPDFVVLSDHVPTFRRTEKAPFAIVGLLLMIFLAALRIEPTHVAACVGAVFVVLAGAITMEESYREVEWRVVFLVAALIPIGLAVEHAGVAVAMANQITNLVGGYGPFAVMVALALLSSVLSQTLDGALTVVLLAPIAIRIANELDFSPYPYLMAIALSASVAFVTPFSHKAHLLVMGPGGYRTRDYLVVGSILSVITMIAVLCMVPQVYPF